MEISKNEKFSRKLGVLPVKVTLPHKFRNWTLFWPGCASLVRTCSSNCEGDRGAAAQRALHPSLSLRSTSIPWPPAIGKLMKSPPPPPEGAAPFRVLHFPFQSSPKKEREEKRGKHNCAIMRRDGVNSQGKSVET